MQIRKKKKKKKKKKIEKHFKMSSAEFFTQHAKRNLSFVFAYLSSLP